MVLDLADFTKQLSPGNWGGGGGGGGGGGSGLKFCKEDLNMAAINVSPLQNLKWL